MKKVLIGMSGGVDSSVSALLLKEQGYEVIGATMILFDDENSNKTVEDAKKICDQLNIKHYILDFKQEFKKKVIDNFINSYKEGKTPNPCIECNRFLKFGALFDFAKELGCDYIATGHYAKIKDNKLFVSDVLEKDQTYFLYKIKKEVLPHIILPLEKFNSKEEIRKIALDNNLFVHEKKDSQEICFIPNDDYKVFLNNNMDEVPSKGNFILDDGKIIGVHEGITNYTIGQRKGLGISYSKPLYVTKIDASSNNIHLGDESDLYSNALIADNINLLVDKFPDKVEAKVRYRAKLAKASVYFIDDNKVKVVFDLPQKSITKGQSVVFYDKDLCLGGGIISEVL